MQPLPAIASRSGEAGGLLGLRWDFEVNDQPQSGWLEFLRPSGERQKHISALIGALATGCEAPGLYGKKSLLVIFAYSQSSFFTA
jgi:hypothetical protein